jgi:hypothetical protein
VKEGAQKQQQYRRSSWDRSTSRRRIKSRAAGETEGAGVGATSLQQEQEHEHEHEQEQEQEQEEGVQMPGGPQTLGFKSCAVATK